MMMTDYIPKTEYVKDSYVWFRDEVTADAARLEFDRWLEQHDREVAKAERERIIKLLEVTGWLHVCDGGCLAKETCSARDYLIALIKGEE